MKSYILILLLSLLGLTNAHAAGDFEARAAETDTVLGFEPGTIAPGTRLSDAEVRDALVDILTYSRYESIKISHLPVVVMVPQEEFVKAFCEAGEKDCGLLGVRVWADPNSLYVRDVADFFPGTIKAVIRHELTHWIQSFASDMGDNKRECGDIASREIEAYAVGYLYDHLMNHKSYSFYVPDTYEECMLASFRPGAHPKDGDPIGVIADPVITRIQGE